jgi:hypothetical protein
VQQNNLKITVDGHDDGQSNATTTTMNQTPDFTSVHHYYSFPAAMLMVDCLVVGEGISDALAMFVTMVVDYASQSFF